MSIINSGYCGSYCGMGYCHRITVYIVVILNTPLTLNCQKNIFLV